MPEKVPVPPLYDSDDDFFARSLKAAGVLGLLAAAFMAVKTGYGLAWRYLLFLAWMILNFMVWRAGLKEMIGPRRAPLLLLLFSAKLLFLVLLGFLLYLAKLDRASRVFAVLSGLTTPFAVMILKAAGRALSKERKFPVKISEAPAEETVEDDGKDAT
jgi:hypothetical protein